MKEAGGWQEAGCVRPSLACQEYPASLRRGVLLPGGSVPEIVGVRIRIRIRNYQLVRFIVIYKILLNKALIISHILEVSSHLFTERYLA